MLTDSSLPQLHTTLHVARYALFALMLLASYFIRPRLIPFRPTAATLLEPALIGIGNQAESVLHRIRVSSLQRMAILHHGDSRSKVSQPAPLAAISRRTHGASVADTSLGLCELGERVLGER